MNARRERGEGNLTNVLEPTLDAIKDLGEEAWEKAQEKGRAVINEAVEKSENIWDDVVEAAGETWDQAQKAARKHPYKAALYAVLIGLAVRTIYRAGCKAGKD